MNACAWLDNCDTRNVSVDWMRFTGPRANIEAVSDVLSTFFGKWEACKGRFYLDTGRKWGSAGVWYDVGEQAAEHCVVEVPGGSLALISVDERRELAHEIMSLGFKAKRFDVAVDVRGKGIGLIEDMIASCKREELVGARLWEPKSQHRIGKGLSAHGVCIGVRGGDGSGRYIRCYDKGLETQTEPAGQWVRFEVEFADHCALEVADAFTLAHVVDLDRDVELMRRALGAVEFRKVTGSKMLTRRPLVEWWAAFTAGVECLRVKGHRVLASAAGWASWTKRAVWPQLLAYAEKSGRSVSELVEACCGHVEASVKACKSQVGRELLAELCPRERVAWT